MKQLTGNQIRKMFLDFFESKGHKVEPSHSLIPNDDPTLLWINAGVAAIKKYFDGTIKPENPRITNAQKSIRTNDIENVGKTARHHTFFEMLGNFSIGDYFKKEAIDFAWELLTDEKWFAFEKDKLYITVHDRDDEAYNYWVDVKGVDPAHMLKTPGNFWEIGEGPCGPDSEIFYDRGEKYDPEGLGLKLFYEELENDRYIEIWNLVFSQYNSQEGVAREDYKELPQKNIDTGMGLERITSIIQDGETNFDTDFFLPIIHEAEKLATVSYNENKMAYRVIADHIRTVTFALADGALFDNAGRGYVLRRILRRAVRYGKQIGIEKAFMYNLVAVVSDVMKEFYDYLPEKVNYISDLVKKEEEAFHKTLSNGEKLLSSLISKNVVVKKGDKVVLSSAVGIADGISEEDLGDVIPAVVNEFKAASEEAKNILKEENAMQSVIDNSFTRLAEVMHKLEYKKGNKTALSIAVGIADGISEEDLGDVIPAVVNEFKAASEEAKNILKEENAMQSVIDNSFTRLAEVMHKLEYKKGNKTALSIAVGVADGISEEDLEDVIPAVVNEFKAASEEAKNILKDENAIQSVIDNSFTRLAEVMHKLELKCDKIKLRNFVDSVNIFPKIYSVFGVALENAQKALEDENIIQSDVDKAYSGLVKAYIELKNVLDNGYICGKDAFKLYDTYGFPFELTLEIAEESGLKVDEEGFREELKIQRERSRGAREDSESMASQKPDLMAFDLPSTFEYDPTNINGVVIGLFKDGVKTEVLDDYGEVVFDVTTFYAEMGGQCADTGIIYNDSCKANVINVLKAPNQQHLHFVKVEKGTISIGDVLTLEIDKEKRNKITANHTATHLLQAALKEVVGSHINQAGSYVDDQRLRFDFTHFEKISNEQIKAVEQKVNSVIFNGIGVEIVNMTKDEALASGAMALFDEKYGDTVRVVSVGDFSKELCGGCHVANSANIGLFKIETEESVGSGVRRIEAITGKSAYEALVQEKETVDTISSLLKLKNRKEVVNKVSALNDELASVKKEVENLNAKLNALNAASKANDIQDINGIKVLFVEESLESAKAKQLTFDFRDKIDSGIIILVSQFEDKCSYFVGVTKDYVTNGFKAGDIVKKINAVVDGRGGGKPDFAQGGCPINEKISSIKDELKNFF